LFELPKNFRVDKARVQPAANSAATAAHSTLPKLWYEIQANFRAREEQIKLHGLIENA
jgi:hypothetical protein